MSDSRFSARDFDQRPARRLGNIVSKFGSTLDRTALLKLVVDEVGSYLQFDNLAVLLMNVRGDELRIVKAVGYPEGVHDKWRFGLGQGLVGVAAESRESQIVTDVQADQRYINAAPATRSEIAIPLLVGDRVVGVLDIGSHVPNAFDESHVRFAEFIARPLATALENTRLYMSIQTQAQSLSVMHELSRELTSILDLEKLMEKVAHTIKRLIDYHGFALMLWNEKTQLLEREFSLRFDERMYNEEGIPLGQGITGTAAVLRHPIRVPNVQVDARFISCDIDIPVRSELAIPLTLKDQLVGVLDLESTEYDAFSARDEQMLATLGSSIAIAVENARLYEKVRSQERQMTRDLSAARAIQTGLMPKKVPQIEGIEIAHGYCPVRELGGDFYDFLKGPNGRLGVTIGDVSGKGTPAALYGSLAVGMLRGRMVRDALDPSRMLSKLNENLCQRAIDNVFVAILYAIFDPSDRSLSFSAAGLPRPWLVRDGEARSLEFEGMPLGIVPNTTFSEIKLKLLPGDLIVMMTDGLTEATSIESEELGPCGVKQILESLHSASAEHVVNGLMHARKQHTLGQEEDKDDCTIVALRVT